MLTRNFSESASKRIEIADCYLRKAKDSLTAAQLCLQARKFESACSLAWFSVLQNVNAFAYMLLDCRPRGRHSNFKHNEIARLFRMMMAPVGTSEEVDTLMLHIKGCYARRTIADYAAEGGALSEAEAAQSVRTAKEVYRALKQLSQLRDS